MERSLFPPRSRRDGPYHFGIDNTSLAPPAGGRLAALDLFRGATVAAMIFVNNPGDWGHLYWPFDHAEWHGWTPTDLIFPFFLFIVGTAGVLSLEKRSATGATSSELARHALTRGMTIVLVGWLMAWYPFTAGRLAHLRIPGVLPRIGLVYALGTLVVLLSRRGSPPARSASAPAGRLAVSVAAVLFAVAVLLLLHTLLLGWPGFDLTREGNIQRAVDLALLKGHTWKKDWDPEGFVSTLTAIATMLTGTLAGLVLRSGKSTREKVRRLLAWGAAGFLAGEVWSLVLPINKNLWTGSYVLLTSGQAAISLGLSIFFIDVKGVRRPFGFFLAYGRNPLLVFVLSGLLAKTFGLVKWAEEGGGKVSLHGFLYRGFSWISDPTLASHAWALATVLFWWGVMKLFDRRGWYWKV